MIDDARAQRRAEQRTRIHRRRRFTFAAALIALIALVAALAGGGSRERSARAQREQAAAAKAAAARAAALADGGPLAPASVGGLPALWAPANVVAPQPQTSAAYLASATRPGPAGYILIADRGNNRILVVNPEKQVVYEYPNAEDRRAGRVLVFNDDTFVEPGGQALIANEEDNHAIVEISLQTRALRVLFGHPGEAGTDRTHLHTPDDAYMLPDGTITVADAYNCRIVFIRDHRIVRQIGEAGVCRHEPPAHLEPVNGDTPLPDGAVMISELNSNWIDEVGPEGRLRFAVKAPVSYPSDPQPLPGGRILLADYANPGHILIMDHAAHVLWRYGPATGAGRLDHPSLAMALPNGNVAVNDDYRDRVVVIDPRTNRIVWQYGHTDVAGSAPGFVNTPDGMDFVPYGPHGEPDYAAVVHP
jgi:DNA-binding beta-propeller fold protein YncE